MDNHVERPQAALSKHEAGLCNLAGVRLPSGRHVPVASPTYMPTPQTPLHKLPLAREPRWGFPKAQCRPHGFLLAPGSYLLGVCALHGAGAVRHVANVSHQLQEPLQPFGDAWVEQETR